MATWDKADVLQKLKDMLRRPEADDVTDPEFYQLLSQGQEQWLRIISSLVPDVNYCEPTKLVSSDGGYTYQFPDVYAGSGYADSVWFCELYETNPRGRLMRPTAFFSASGDGYVFEGDLIRFPGGEARQFSDGPYARYVQNPPDIDASTDPVLQPKDARALIITRAAIIWATEGGFVDPSPYMTFENRVWNGDPQQGIVGVSASLQVGNVFGGTEAYDVPWTPWYRGIHDEPGG